LYHFWQGTLIPTHAHPFIPWPTFAQDASGTAWDSSATTGKKPITLPYSTDSDVSTNFSPQELKNIINIWRMVSEDYAPFNVDVTTEFPGEQVLGNSSNPIVGIRVSIGDDLNDWCADCGGGIAYVGAFGNRYYNPGEFTTAVFVFQTLEKNHQTQIPNNTCIRNMS
jgi:hypothetical protein